MTTTKAIIASLRKRAVDEDATADHVVDVIKCGRHRHAAVVLREVADALARETGQPNDELARAASRVVEMLINPIDKLVEPPEVTAKRASSWMFVNAVAELQRVMKKQYGLADKSLTTFDSVTIDAVELRVYGIRCAMLARSEPDLPVESVAFQAGLHDRVIQPVPEKSR